MAEPAPAYFVVQTKNSAERYAYEFLTNRRPYSDQMFEVYYPRVMVERSHAGRRQMVERPFLSRMLFVRDDGRGTDKLRSAPGVACLLRFGESVVRASQSVIDRIRAREDGGFVRVGNLTAQQVQDLRADDRCRYNTMVGLKPTTFDAIFQQRTAAERADVLIRIFGGMRTVNVALKDLELA